jgi:hypothetical protein
LEGARHFETLTSEETDLTLGNGGASIASEFTPKLRDEVFTLEEPEAREEIDR